MRHSRIAMSLVVAAILMAATSCGTGTAKPVQTPDGMVLLKGAARPFPHRFISSGSKIMASSTPSLYPTMP